MEDEIFGIDSLSESELRELKIFKDSPTHKLFKSIGNKLLTDLALRLASAPIETSDKALCAVSELAGRKKMINLLLRLPVNAENELKKREEVKKAKTPKKSTYEYLQ